MVARRRKGREHEEKNASGKAVFYKVFSWIVSFNVLLNCRKDTIKLKKGVKKDCFSYFWRSLSKKEADMTQIFHSMIAAILGISEKQIGQTLSLLDDGATIRSSAATARK